MEFDFGQDKGPGSDNLGSIDLALDKETPKRGIVPKVLAGVGIIVVLGVGGSFLLNRSASLSVPTAEFSIPNKAPSIAEDDIVLKVSYAGSTYDISAKTLKLSDIYENQQIVKGEAPSATARIAFAQSLVLGINAQQVGLAPSKDDIKGYLMANFKAKDIDTAAEDAGVTKVEMQCLVWADMYSTLVADKVKTESGDALTGKVEMPERLEGVADDVKDSAYSDYIMAIAKDEYDSEKMAWTSTDGPFYQALEGEEWDGYGATYYQALKAYSAAVSVAAERVRSGTDPFTNYSAKVMADADIELVGIS